MSRILERGNLFFFFFYRPRVETDRVDDLGDVQRFFLVLEPDGARRFRRLVVGRKRLPDPSERERTWAFVAEVAKRPEELQDELERKVYETKTRGTRVQPEARPAGEARYAIVDHEGHTHIAYALELPRRRGEVQKALRIEREGSFIAAVRNPDAPAPRGTGLPSRERAEFPKRLAETFRGRRFAPLNPPDFLDYEGAEIVLIGAAEDAGRELGIDFDTQRERLDTADLVRDLRLRIGRDVPAEPLKGRWA
ncbi:MAG: hypothetical protein ACJ757_10265 [Gaiellaceae bacterium]